MPARIAYSSREYTDILVIFYAIYKTEFIYDTYMQCIAQQTVVNYRISACRGTRWQRQRSRFLTTTPQNTEKPNNVKCQCQSNIYIAPIIEGRI